MTKEQFIKEVAKYVQKHAPKYGIKICSPIIAQFCLESGYGTSNKVKKTLPDGSIEWRHNYVGLKWRNNRCAISNDYFEEGTAEQNTDGTYIGIKSKFFKFKSLEDCVIGYFQFTNISAYSNLKGVTDPETYLKNIKDDKYATSIDYVQKNMSVIKKWNLTKYDKVINNNDLNNIGGAKMKINIHAGHNPDGKTACGAIGLIRESTEARRVKDKVMKMLREQGHEVFDCTVDNGTSQNDVLKKIVSKCNTKTVDLDISIHFNAGGILTRDGKTTGTEVYVYSSDSKAKDYAQKVVNSIAALGFKNRGVKYSKSLYFLRNTKNPSMLIECCFVTDPEDVALYNADKMAQAIVKGITGVISPITTNTTTTQTTKEPGTKKEFKVKVKAGSLNIRAGAGTSYKVVGKITDKGIYTIVDTHGNWGKLKSGKGWINISSLYATRV